MSEIKSYANDHVNQEIIKHSERSRSKKLEISIKKKLSIQNLNLKELKKIKLINQALAKAKAKEIRALNEQNAIILLSLSEGCV